MILRPFNTKNDLETINTWLIARDKKQWEASTLPENGLIAYSDNVPIAAAFLRLCEGQFGMIDALVTNPEISGELRHIAIDQVINRLLSLANSLHLKALLAFSVDKGTLERAERLGFEKRSETIIALDLSKVFRR